MSRSTRTSLLSFDRYISKSFEFYDYKFYMFIFARYDRKRYKKLQEYCVVVMSFMKLSWEKINMRP